MAQGEELKRHLQARGLSTAGPKGGLVKRLKEAESCAAARTVQQAGAPTSGAAGPADPGDAETSRKVRITLNVCAHEARARMTSAACDRGSGRPPVRRRRRLQVVSGLGMCKT